MQPEFQNMRIFLLWRKRNPIFYFILEATINEESTDKKISLTIEIAIRAWKSIYLLTKKQKTALF